jgi:hypothetical protein
LEKLASYDLENQDREFTDKEIRKTRFKLLKFLGKEYNIVIYINGSPARTDIFRKFAEKLILIDNHTK